jgi:membrane protein
MGHAVPPRALAAGAVIFGLVMLVVHPVGSVYLPRALQTSADRYGTIGVAFTYIGWLYILAFCLLMTAILGQVVAQDEGPLGLRSGAVPASHAARVMPARTPPGSITSWRHRPPAGMRRTTRGKGR